MFRAIGVVWTATLGMTDFPTRFTLTLGPGKAARTSAVAAVLPALTALTRSAKPVTVTVVVFGGLMRMRPDGTVYAIPTCSVLDVGGF